MDQLGISFVMLGFLALRFAFEVLAVVAGLWIWHRAFAGTAAGR